MPIPVKTQGQQKTFEQMVEEELAKQHAKEAGIEAAKSRAIDDSDAKKAYLKKKAGEPSAKKISNTTAKKSYKYYADNFSKEGSLTKVKFEGRIPREVRQKKLKFDTLDSGIKQESEI